MTPRTTPDRASDLQAHVRSRLVEARNAASLTQQEVAERMGVTQATVSRWESGDRDLGVVELDAFALATCQPLEFFLPPSEPPTSDHAAKMAVVSAEAYDDLRDAAMWVVLTWDTNGTQHATMSSLRRALGLPGKPPTTEDAQARLRAYMDEVIR